MKRFLRSFLLLLLAGYGAARAQAPVNFKGENVVIGKNVAILEDETNKLGIEEVSRSERFVPSKNEIPNMQLSSSDFWLRFTLANHSPEAHLLLTVQYPTLIACELFYDSGSGFQSQRLSDSSSYGTRKYKHQDFIFDLIAPTNTSRTFYLHVKSGEQMILPIIVGTPQKVAESMLTRDLLWGVFIGLMTVMMLYNLFVFISTKDISYLYYVFYGAFIGLTQTTLNGYTYRFMFSDSPRLFQLGLVIFPALAGISAMLFVRSFLHTAYSVPRLNKLFPYAIGLYSIAIGLRLLGFDQASYRMIDISALVTTAVLYIIAFRISMQGYRPAKLFLVAWTIFFAGLILFILRNLGILPYNNFTNYTMQAGIAIEVTLLSLALADKINILKREKEASQAEALAAAQENERIIREQNTILEVKVEERTHALQETLENLKQTQSQLVESEKMASLGQLTAGIAHEINNPINFVTSNVNPLRRDVDMLLDALHHIEGVGLSDASPDEKKKQIEEYKEELDFDYLKTEISHLLRGVHEGASRTAEIVKGLRVFSRLDEDDLKKADINEGMDSTLVIINNLLNNRITVKKNFGNLPLIECFPGKLNQVFLNILSNAVHAVHAKFGEEQGGAIEITTTTSGDLVTISIRDNGTGMDENTQKKIYEPFFTTKDVGEGTGLGMSITYNTIKKHHGTISLRSEPGEGTEFIIALPVIHKVQLV
jgi:signal transduction histidine kinase